MKRKLHVVLIIFSIIAVAVSCEKSAGPPTPPNPPTTDAADIKSYSVAGMSTKVSISAPVIKVRFDDTTRSAKDLVASFTLSPGAHAYINGVLQESAFTKNSFESTLNYTIKGSDGSVKHWIIYSTNNDYSENWGLGGFVKKTFTNDHSYNWYFNQAGTGPYSDINCGPTSVTMAMKWSDSTYSGTPQNARDYYPLNTELWGLFSIGELLNDYKFPHLQIQLGDSQEKTRDILKAQLDMGNIVMLPLIMANVRQYSGASPDPRVDKYYPGGFGHFIVAFGYKEVDDEFYFQVNDPWSLDYINSDGSPKGKSRFYRYEDLYVACLNADNFAMVVSKKY